MILITIARTLFYQFFLIFIGISIGFIANAEWVGYKSCVIEKSINNIFFQRQFDAKTCEQIKNFGKFRLWAFNDRPKNFEIIEDGLLAEEFYIAKFRYTDSNGNIKEKIETTRIRWKTWEYYWEDADPWTKEEINDYIKNGTLNSNESDKALRLYRELQERKRNEKTNNSGSSGPAAFANFIL